MRNCVKNGVGNNSETIGWKIRSKTRSKIGWKKLGGQIKCRIGWTNWVEKLSLKICKQVRWTNFVGKWVGNWLEKFGGKLGGKIG